MCLRSPFFSDSHHRVFCRFRQWVLLSASLMLVACSGQSLFESPQVAGIISVPDSNIAESGIAMLEKGGNAADAMGAMLMTGAVVMPSRMGLGAGGVCQILDPSEGRVKTLNFLPRPMSFDKKIATPSMARGVYALQNKYGHKPWREILSVAKEKAEKGVVISDLLAKDILNSSKLNATWKKYKKGDTLKQPELAKTLNTLANSGAGVLYNGQLAESIVAQSDQIVKEDLKAFKASFMDSIDVSKNGKKTFFPNPTDLSSEAYMIWKNAQNDKADRQQQAIEGMEKLEKNISKNYENVHGIGLIAADKSGLVISCAVSMGQPFGTGQLLKEGFFLSASMRKRDTFPVYANFLETNPDITDVEAAVVGVGDYALVDGLNDWSYRLNGKYLLDNVDVSQNRLNDKASFAYVECVRGYPNHVGSCREKEGFYLVEEKD